ncbi:MAG: tRNA (adenosine(37)-N6)-dimethylallyltransferase MiaA, partial [Ignavibacteria bacterium]|nr:tRNA (adenosine(37)-N6)-dimethylallyltransferase MiaA [Ignavibacteria bacterium]
MNKADSERIATDLESKGYKPVSKQSKADLIVVNMCSVRQSAVDRVYGLYPKFRKLKTKKPKLKTVLAGCILKEDKKKFRKEFDSIWEMKDYLANPPKYKNNSLAYIPISNGCNNTCSYCVVPFTRGRLICRNHKEILKDIKNTVKNGFKGIWLLGQNVNDYNSPTDRTVNFPKLLTLVSNVPGDFQIKFTSPNPKNFSDELIDVMVESEKIAHYLNLPVQSGDNQILKRMNRPYTVTQYKNLVKKIKEKIPDIFLSTDIIVGFPGETKKQFENTVKLFRKINFDMAYISKFSPRPGTAVSKMKDSVSPKEKERRWKILNDILLKNWRKKSRSNKKLIVVLGQTSSGKSELAVKLAEKFNGEIISADSRQIYKGMDIGTGKITKKEMRGIPHYLLDIASPKRRFSVAQYRKLVIKAINKIFNKGKIPILCGGTGFYIQAVVDGIIIPEVKPDWRLRSDLEQLSTEELFNRLKKLDPKRAKTIDKNNRRRLIRALEIVIKTKKPVPAFKK